MDTQSTHNHFIFNNEIDTDFLFSLYENDFRYMQEVFAITLSQLATDIRQVESAYHAHDLSLLKSAVHKIKPSMGFVGLNQMQSACIDFENLCLSVTSTKDIEQEFRQLWHSLARSRDIIETEYKKLKSYNGEA